MRISLHQLQNSRRFQELSGLLLLFLGLVSLLAIVSYSQQDASWFHARVDDTPARNWIGWFGATLSEVLLQVFGAIAFAIPFVLGVFGWFRLRRRPLARPYLRLVGYGALGLSLAALMTLIYSPLQYGGRDHTFQPGGVIGTWTADVMVAVLNRPGAVLFSSALVVSLLVLITRFSFSRAFDLAADALAVGGAWSAAAGRRLWSEARDGLRAARRPPGPPTAAAPPPQVRRRDSIPFDAAAAERQAANVAAGVVAGPAGATGRGATPAAGPDVPVTPRQPAAPKPKQVALPMPSTERGYALPPLHLLADPVPQTVDNERELVERAKVLTGKFREFAVEGSVVAIHPGPVVTTFEYKPDAGVKYSKITGMTDDLCLALKAESVRIDRMPGRSTIAIEVPNRKQETIYPRELIGSERFRESRSKLTLALGKDIGGDVFTAELDRMPHLLIAGATGAGKSVMLNGMIMSILYKSTPADVRMIMIDTKMIELGIYADIPHLLIPVVTESKHASAALQWAVREMERRYKKLAALGVRNLDQYNQSLAEKPGTTMESEQGGDPIPLTHLPYIVIVIDEMADLMMVTAADVEESIMRLAQMARAVGIHLLLATQRPSVDVITGTIKANFPSRIAFRVSQRVDSRTIIDQNGAEQLLGRGDMLYLPSGSTRLIRLHSGLITEAELNRLTAFLKKTAKPVYDDSVLKDPEEGKSGTYDDSDRDPMFVESVRLVLQEGQCSITLIQRRLRLGYARAARIVDMMEQAGIVGPADGSKPRELLVGPEILDTLESSR